MERRVDYQFKIAFVGSGLVGKTSTILRYTTNTFRENYIPTLGVGFARKLVNIKDKYVSLQIWDMGAQEYLGHVRANYFNGVRGIVFVFDISKRESFNELIGWKEEVDEHISDYAMLVAANKKDLENQRRVTTEEGAKLSREFSAEYIEISAKTGYNIDHAFRLIAEKSLEKHHELIMEV